MNPKLVLNIDSTSLSSSGCILNFIRTVVGDPQQPTVGAYRQKVNKVSLNYGIAVHKFLDTMYKTRGHYPAAKDAAVKWFESTPHIPDLKRGWLSDTRHLLTTCYMVWTEFVEKDGSFELLQLPDGKGGTQSATEVTFTIPYYEDDHIIVNLCGTIDKVGKFVGGVFDIDDWKTTSHRSDKPAERKEYFSQYEMSRQLRLYTLACKIMHRRHPESILGQVGETKMGASITAIFLKPNANETIVERSDVMQYTDEQLDHFENKLLLPFIKRLSTHVSEMSFPKEGILNGSCEGKWSRCQFWYACKSPDNIAQVLLGREWKRTPYDPLNFND